MVQTGANYLPSNLVDLLHLAKLENQVRKKNCSQPSKQSIAQGSDRSKLLII